MNKIDFFIAWFYFFVFKKFFLSGEKTEGLPISVKINTAVAFSDGSVEIIGVSNSLE